MIYMDNAATTMHKPQEVIDAVVNAMNSMGNAGRGASEAALSASRVIYDTRDRLAELFGAEDARRIAFTSNSTESLNIAIKGSLNPGDHVILSDDIYGGTFRIIGDVFGKYGIEHAYVDMSELDEVKAAIRPNTKMFFIETPTNPMMKVADIHALSEIAKGIGSLTVVDNTFLTPYFQKPLQLGADPPSAHSVYTSFRALSASLWNPTQ